MKNKALNNRPELKAYRKALRNNGTPAEAYLWGFLKNKQLEGKKFRRQFSVGNYILDFYCPMEKLCIELDGAGHYTDSGYAYDQERSAFLNAQGIKVIRFENKTVFDHTENVLETIKLNFKQE